MSQVLDGGAAVSDPFLGPSPASKWAAVAGLWTVDGNRAIYQGPDTQDVKPASGVLLNALRMRDGHVSARIKLSRTERTSAGIVLGYHSMRSEYVVAQLGAYDRAYAVSTYMPDFGWEAIAQAGHIKNLVPDRFYTVEVRLGGQKIRMSVDDVNVLEAVLRRPLEGAGFGLFAYDDASVEFEDVFVRANPLRAFVIMPFREPFNTLYTDVILPEAKDLGFDIVRVDEIAFPGIILEDIRRQIEESHVVVAEISEPNPNVFYELGYAHALGKPAVLLVRREQGKELPFDLRGYRAIFYDDTIGGKRTVQTELKKSLTAIQRDF